MVNEIVHWPWNLWSEMVGTIGLSGKNVNRKERTWVYSNCSFTVCECDMSIIFIVPCERFPST